MVGIYLWLGVVSAILIASSISIWKAISNNINSDFKYSINFHSEGFKRTNFPIVKIKIRNKYRYFLVDTGANINTLDYKCYEEIASKGQVHHVGDMNISGVGTEKVVPIRMVRETFKINNETFEEDFGLITDWSVARDQISKISGLNVVGILGSEFFTTAKWMLDFDNLVIWVKK